MKNFLRSTISRIFRFILAIAIIYVCMVFYLMLSERRIAFPKAIKHKEAREAIADTTMVQKVNCKISDDITLEGFLAKKENLPTILYFPDSDEDAAQFMAETQSSKNIGRLAFNYRGSGENKGTPSEENFMTDALQISNCAKTLSPTLIYAGRGIGAIAATKVRENNPLVLIDPKESFAEKISAKYRYLFPKFLIHTKIALTEEDFKENTPTLLLEDRSVEQISNENFKKTFPKIPSRKRTGETLSEIMDKIIIPENANSNF